MPRALHDALASTDGLRLPPSLALMGGILCPEMMGTVWVTTVLGKSQRGRSHAVCTGVFLQKCLIEEK